MSRASIRTRSKETGRRRVVLRARAPATKRNTPKDFCKPANTEGEDRNGGGEKVLDVD
jgi:hypothetical protein